MKEVKSPKKPLIFYYGIALLVIVLFNVIVSPMLVKARVTEVDYGTFMSMIEQKKIGNVEVEDDQIIFTDKDDAKKIYKTGAMNDPTLTQRLYDSGAKFSKDIETTTSPLVSFLLTFVLPLIIFIGLGQYMGKKLMEQAGGKNSMAFGFGKSNAKVYVPSTQGIHFSDVAGEDEAKESLSEIVDYLHNPKKYSDVGASMPKGVLLVGPPGTGKTMLAKAVAGEANVPFFSMSGSEFVEMFVGMGASKVRDLFSQAKEKAPCIVFIDEIDAIGKKRDGQFSSNDEREQTLNQLLTEMDGFQENIGVIILAATNRPETLDPALTRPGRFDRRVPVELPDLAGREAILKVHAKKIKTAERRQLPHDSKNGIRRIGRGACQYYKRGGSARGQEQPNRRQRIRPRGEHRDGHCRISEKERGALGQRKEGCRLSRDRSRARCGYAVTLGARAEDNDNPPHLRRARLYDAGRSGRQISADKARA